MTVGRDASVSVPLQITAPNEYADPVEPCHARTVTVGDLRADVPVSVLPATRFGTVTASSTHPGYPAESVIDGDAGVGPVGRRQWLERQHDQRLPRHDCGCVRGAGPRSAGWTSTRWTPRSSRQPSFGLRDADVELLVGGQWRTVGQIRGNQAGHMSVSFTPVIADAVRLSITASNSGDYSRVIELTAYPS